MVKGFGCRPVMTYRRALGPASESPRKETRGGGRVGVAPIQTSQPSPRIGGGSTPSGHCRDRD